MSSKVQPVRGTRDLFGVEAARFEAVVAAFRRVGRLYGFQPVDVPIFEFTEVFARSIGETTDVVSKEMYSFLDRGEESITLRPEFTAGIARAYVSNGWQQLAPLKLMAHGPAFRYERPQKGRYRQFHQIDAEILGSGEPQADIDLLLMAQQLLTELGLGDKVELRLNTLGDAPSRAAWREALVAYFSKHQDALSADSQLRLAKNPLRILDSKDDGDRKIVADAPLMEAHLSAEAGAYFARVQAGLSSAGVAFTLDPKLVRGLDYYSHTAFEFVTTHLGAQGTVLGGGRYDGLMEQLGGPHTPCVGWAGGIERLAMLIDEPAKAAVPIALVPLGEAAEARVSAIASALRAHGIAIDYAYKGNIKKRLSKANDAGAPFAIIFGDSELAAGQAQVKNLNTGEQANVAFEALADYFGPRA
jgi:histidyl-tRNA synthetase